MRRCSRCGEEIHEMVEDKYFVVEVGHDPDCPDWNKNVKPDKQI
jgi:hypothetical protein